MDVQTFHFRLRNLSEVLIVSQQLSEYFTDPDEVAIGIYELLINAVEHGNLGIGYDYKTELVRQGTWESEINRRMNLTENAHKEVDVSLVKNKHECALTICDQGKGFNWQHYLTMPLQQVRLHGRGLLIASHCNFDSLIFNAAGNAVTCMAKAA